MMFAREICLVDKKYDIKHHVPCKVIYHGIHKGLKKVGSPVSWKSRQTYCYWVGPPPILVACWCCCWCWRCWCCNIYALYMSMFKAWAHEQSTTWGNNDATPNIYCQVEIIPANSGRISQKIHGWGLMEPMIQRFVKKRKTERIQCKHLSSQSSITRITHICAKN